MAKRKKSSETAKKTKAIATQAGPSFTDKPRQPSAECDGCGMNYVDTKSLVYTCLDCWAKHPSFFCDQCNEHHLTGPRDPHHNHKTVVFPDTALCNICDQAFPEPEDVYVCEQCFADEPVFFCAACLALPLHEGHPVKLWDPPAPASPALAEEPQATKCDECNAVISDDQVEHLLSWYCTICSSYDLCEGCAAEAKDERRGPLCNLGHKMRMWQIPGLPRQHRLNTLYQESRVAGTETLLEMNDDFDRARAAVAPLDAAVNADLRPTARRASVRLKQRAAVESEPALQNNEKSSRSRAS